MSGPVAIPGAASRSRWPDLRALARDTVAQTPAIVSSTSATLDSTRFTPASPPPVLPHPSLPTTKVRVHNSDTFVLALSLGTPVCVLNLANPYLPGGGFFDGSRAQEEQLCYRSTLFKTLSPNYYPLPEPGPSAIYSPSVAVFRSAAPDYDIVEEPTVLSVISVAGIMCSRQDVEGNHTYVHQWRRDAMREKIRFCLRVLRGVGERRVVLGALGCGAFGNPPREVAQLWKDALSEDENKGWWEEVRFAVLARGGDSKMEQSRAEENLWVFQEVLEGLEV